MTQYSKKITTFGVGALVSALMLFFGSCTEVNDKLGGSIVPPGQQLDVEFASFESGMQTYLTLTDSIATSGLDYAYFGTLSEEGMGTTRASALFQFDYATRTDTIHYADRGSVPDSMILVCMMKTLGGDTLKTQSFDVYRLKELLRPDSVYYNGLDYRSMLGEAPMFKFNYSGRPHGGDTYDTLRLEVADKRLAEEFLNELWNVDTLLYETDSLFMQKFNGLCVTPSGTSPKDAAIYGMNLQWDSSYGPSSYLILFGHDYKLDTPDEVEDHIMRAFQITNSTQYAEQASVTAVEHDYSTTTFESMINLNPQPDQQLQNPTSECYVQGLFGVTTTIEFEKDFLDALRALKPEGKEIFINQAMLYVGMAEEDYLLFDAAPDRLGSYLHYASLTPVADYNYYIEESYGSELSYGGKLNRSHYNYSMDIAIYIQQLLLDQEGVDPRITLGMGAYDFLKVANVKLSGVGGRVPIKLDVAYTIIGK